MVKKSRGTRKIRIEVDARTGQMSNEALWCRGWNHLWRAQDTPPHRLLQMLDNGYVEKVRVCETCGGDWLQVCAVVSGHVVINRQTLPRVGYKVPKGTGRLSKAEARKASFGRVLPADRVLAA